MIVRELPSGKDAAGLARYLFGAGKANEHTNQRMLAGSPELMGEWSGGKLTLAEATLLGRVVEASWRRQYAPELAMAGHGRGGISRAGLSSTITQRDREDSRPLAVDHDLASQQDHVYHLTISLHPDEGQYTDEQWNQVATEFMRGMEFIGQEGRPDASWYAVHHGASAEGNDHIHIVACTTLRDGSQVRLHQSKNRAQQVRRERLEKLPFVRPLHDVQRTANVPTLKAITAAEHNKARNRAAAGTGSPEADRVQLQRIVRGAAAQARNEAEFIDHVLAHDGVRVIPAHWEPGNGDVVTGYKVGLTGGIAFGASKLSSDLTLSKLRQRWSETPETMKLAREMWAGLRTAAKTGTGAEAVRLPVNPRPVDASVELGRAATKLREFNDRLELTDPRDKRAWSNATASIAGTATVLATGTPDAFKQHAGRAADVLARQALEDSWTGKTETGPKVPVGLNRAELATRHIQLALRATGTSKDSGWLAVIQQINRAAAAIADAKQARGEYAGALKLNQHAISSLKHLGDYITETTAPAPEPAGSVERAGAATLVEAPRFSFGVEYHDGTPVYPEISKDQALDHIARLQPDPVVTSSRMLDSWKGKDRDVDAALAAKFPKLFDEPNTGPDDAADPGAGPELTEAQRRVQEMRAHNRVDPEDRTPGTPASPTSPNTAAPHRPNNDQGRDPKRRR